MHYRGASRETSRDGLEQSIWRNQNTEPNFGIVTNGMPVDDLDLDNPKTIKLLEAANDFPSGTISKVTSKFPPTQR
jgi:hypothetical protein